MTNQDLKGSTQGFPSTWKEGTMKGMLHLQQLEFSNSSSVQAQGTNHLDQLNFKAQGLEMYQEPTTWRGAKLKHFLL